MLSNVIKKNTQILLFSCFMADMQSITPKEIKSLKCAIQHFQDCYLVSSIGALAKSPNGRKILAENIAHTKDGFRIRFNNINGKTHDFFVSQKEIDDLVYMDKFFNPIPLKQPHNPVVKALEAAMNKLLTQFPSKKPLICRFPNCNEKFEYNKPSNFMEMFTGRKPLVINESSFRISLKSKEKESIEIFDKISDQPQNSFVTGTAINFHKGLSDNHCYSITKTDKNARTIEFFDHRFLEKITLTYEEAIKKLKFIVGYFDKDLM